MKAKMFTLAMTIAISGCDLAFFDTPIESAVRKELKDPGSAIFKDELRVGNRACISVNAKNSFGGYSGTQYAHLVDLGNNKWHVESTNGDLCLTGVLEEKLALDKLNEQGEQVIVETLKKYKLIDDSPKNIMSIKDHNCRFFALKLSAYVRVINNSKDPERKKYFENQVQNELLTAVQTGKCPVPE